ncbi:hypothetical protein CAC42_3712 [Sphaceloma murrayae]|uniref:Uncharacterized protein n=1 Tax=Sphaceloma murrayae TaxID=2082308 RepID=A0A2K1QGY0_9PEZI|nr:hypothetical protein CAC42_3712 [Sphaceloma murrayae]
MDMLHLTTPLPSLVRNKYLSAQRTGSLLFSPTELSLVTPLAEDTKYPSFQLRYCPSLSSKPKPVEHTATTPRKKPFNPFENPSDGLLITPLPARRPTHNLVLNKFPIIPEHFILATHSFAPQTDLLGPADVAMTYALLRAWDSADVVPDDDAAGGDPPQARGGLYGFFNSGPESGASQPHRHVQFVPFEGMERDVPDGTGWEPLMLRDWDGRGGQVPGLPFRAERTGDLEGKTAEEIYEMYVGLVERHVGIEEVGVGERKVRRPLGSYNLGLTRGCMAIARRTGEAYVFSDGEGVEHRIAVNGTILAGTLMVKGEKEWDWLRADHAGLTKVLAALGDTSKATATHL